MNYERRTEFLAQHKYFVFLDFSAIKMKLYDFPIC